MQIGKRIAFVFLIVMISCYSYGGTFVAYNTGNWSSRSTWITTKTGTVTVASGTTTVVGSGTAFTTELQVGDKIYKDGGGGFTLVGTVASITNNTNLTLTSGAAVALSAYALYSHGLPASTDNVQIGFININLAVTLTVDGNYSCNLIYFVQNGGSASTVDITSSNSLSVTNYLYLAAANSAGNVNTLNVSGTLTAGGLYLQGASISSQNRISQLTIQNGGVANITGDININSITKPEKNIVSAVGTGVLNLGGNFLSTTVSLSSGFPYTTPPVLTPSTTILMGTNSFASTSVLNLNGTNILQVLPVTATTTYGNIYFNNTGNNVATLNANITTTNVLGDIKVQSGIFTNQGASSSTTLNAASSNFTNTGNAGKTFEVDNSATLKQAGTSSFPTGFGTIILQTTSTVDYIGTTQTISPQNFGNLTVSGSGTKTLGGSITVQGALILSAGTLSTNNLNISIGGNWTNNSTFTPGTGTITFNGTSAQIVSGSQALDLFNLVTNNSSGITLNTNLSVSGAHSFTNGMIITSATPNYLVYQAGSSYSGDNDSRHVNGWVKKYGTTNFVFPVGDATYERTAGITNLSASSEINCKYYTPTNNIFNLFSPVVAVDPNEYWQIDKISGGTAKIALNWDNAKVAFPNVLLTDILVAHYTGPNWIDAGGVGTASGNPLTTGNVTSNAVTTFSPFTFGFTSTPLPLRLISFNAERRSGTSFINWVTQSEENVDHFEIQRSATPTNFLSIGNVAARNITSRQEYYFEDHSSLNGIAYYRLRSVDRDGKTSYSKIIAVNERQTQSAAFIVLNPARNAITIFNKTGKDGTFDYKLMNAAGQLLLKGITNMGVNGNAVLPLPSQTPAGVYLLELSNQTIQFRQKILIEK